MRHVDHAHDAEGDGKADGGEQQYRAERNAVPGVLHRVPQHQAVVDRGDGGGRGLHDRRRGAGRQAGEEPERLLVAALAHHVDGGELVLILGIGTEENDRRARLQQRTLDPRVLLLGDGGVERRQRACLTRLEHRLRGLVSRAGIAGQQRKPAERGVERAAQPIVDADIVEIVRRVARDWLAGGGVGELAGIVLDVDRLAFGAEHQLAVLQGTDDGFRARIAARGDRIDARRWCR